MFTYNICKYCYIILAILTFVNRITEDIIGEYIQNSILFFVTEEKQTAFFLFPSTLHFMPFPAPLDLIRTPIQISVYRSNALPFGEGGRA